MEEDELEKLTDDELQAQPCQICGGAKSVAHHDDYRQRLEISWLCQKHHSAWHRVFIAEGLGCV